MPLVQFSLGVRQGCSFLPVSQAAHLFLFPQRVAGGGALCTFPLVVRAVVAEVRLLRLAPAVKHPATALGRPLRFLVLKTVTLGLWD